MTTAPTITVLGTEVPRVQLTATLYRLRKFNACEDRYQHLVAELNGIDDKEPINILTILEHNGADDALWALCAVEQDCEQVARLMAADFAEAILPIFEKQRPNDKRPRQAIETTRRFAVGLVGADERDAAGAAAWAAAGAAAGAAAWAAAWAAARDAAGAAARAAAWAAAGAGAAAWASQAQIIRKYLLTELRRDR